jgi:adhesin transport system outer membrane protein
LFFRLKSARRSGAVQAVKKSDRFLPTAPTRSRRWAASAWLLAGVVGTLLGAAAWAAPARPASKGKLPKRLQLAAPAAPEMARGVGRCGDEEAGVRAAPEQGVDVASQDWLQARQDPRVYLVRVAEQAVERSRGVGVARLLEAAARDEVRDAEAAALPQMQLTLSGGYAGSASLGVQGPHGIEARTALQVNGPLWDWGRQKQLVEWRRQLAEAAAAGRAGAAEQVALQAVALSLDRSRYGLQAQVYGQYVRKMACLVDQLKAITALDQGRASELTQAQKNQQQAELALATTQDFLKSTETRLRRLVGDPLPPPAALAAVLARLPELAALQKDLIEAQDVAQASAQALAARRLAEAVAAGQKPQLSYLGSVNGRAGNGRQADWIGGVQLSIPLFNAQDEPQRAAALKRAAAADAQRDETLEAKTWRLQEVHDAAGNALDRARRITELLRASQQLRSATLLQWQQLGRRSLFDVMSAEADYYALRVAHVNALYDAQQAVALMGSMGRGVLTMLR